MVPNNGTGFSVLDMVNEYAQNNDIDDIDDIFKKDEPTPVTDKTPAEEPSEEPVENTESPKKRKEWVPDESLTEGMEEFNTAPPTYDASEIIPDGPKELRNINDDEAIKDASTAYGELELKEKNINEAKARLGLRRLQIPEGEMQTRILIAASDPNHDSAQAALTEIFTEIINNYPDYLIDPVGGEAADTESPNGGDSTTEVKKDKNIDEDEIKVIIDKSQASEVSWTPEEYDKIKKARTLELNIVESKDIEFSAIEDVDDNMVDQVLSQYQRKVNDVTCALPASKYRATFTGLSYSEVIDLESISELNDLDSERKKWSLCFKHMRNPSIGPWRDYRWYTDPKTNKRVEIAAGTWLPMGIDPSSIHSVSMFEDFLRHTSYVDLTFMLWKILCATSLDQEIIQIKCHNKIGDTKCNNHHEWVYRPVDLLDKTSINPSVLEDMKKTTEANTTEDIMKVYKTAYLNSESTVTLPSSGITLVFGHISAYDYLNEIFGRVHDLLNTDNPSEAASNSSKILVYTMLTVIKSFLIPKETDGANKKYWRIKNIDSMMNTLSDLDEVDWQVASEVTEMMTSPYQFKYSLRDVVCPKCKKKTDIPIDNIDSLLFIVTRSLMSTSVTLKSH